MRVTYDKGELGLDLRYVSTYRTHISRWKKSGDTM